MWSYGYSLLLEALRALRQSFALPRPPIRGSTFLKSHTVSSFGHALMEPGHNSSVHSSRYLRHAPASDSAESLRYPSWSLGR